eukprot:gb/GEZN01009185.1/.p1 GENE.gb/GEZN01009185.1/~~gb/GEZN01009185.1/.p1  ORF type:complete len:351 (+),score=39.83 gb/GEZN01009185.1/:50-1102(+)
MSFGQQEFKANPDREVPHSPKSTIQSLSWSPAGSLLVSGSWDCQVSCWQVNEQNGEAKAMAQIKHDAPVLATDFHHDGTAVFSASCDTTVKLWKFQGNTPTTVAKHDKPIKSCHWIKEKNILLTGSWDKTLKYWDLRQQNPILIVRQPERVYCTDVLYPLVISATANRKIIMYNLQKPSAVFRESESKLKYQSRAIACFGDRNGTPSGYALGSVEGRVSIGHIDDAKKDKDFAFKCHRLQTSVRGQNSVEQVYAVNAITFHKHYWTFATCGSDGHFTFWDKDSRHRLKQNTRCSNSITAAAYSKDYRIFAYALGYDWSKGAEGYNNALPNAIYLHSITAEESKPKSAKRD